MVKRILLLAATTVGVLMLAEGFLTLVGFRYEIKPEGVEFGWPNPKTRDALYELDPDLFWVTSDYRESLHAIRSRQRRPDVLLLGDSCTEFSDYPNRFRERLQQRHPGADLLVEELGVGGWSSHQGLRQLLRDVLPLRPRAVTLYFGWNDHWIGFGVEDDQIETAWRGSLLGSLRLAQLLRRARVGWLGLSQTVPPLRVPPDDFRGNLREMARASKAVGTVPVLLTAPTSHERGAEPEKLRERHIPQLEQLVPLHRRYAAIVREVAHAEAAVLCDLEAQYAELPTEKRRSDFTSDGIHLSRSGAVRVAGLLADCFDADESLRTLWR